MSLKATAIGSARQPSDYPKMMINEKGMVVLFHGHEKGMVVGPHPEAVGPDPYGRVGYYSETWDMEAFKFWAGTVKIEQN